MTKKISRRDLILILVIVIAAIAIWFGYRMMHSGEGGTIRISVDGENYGEYSLDEAQEIPIQNADGDTTNTLVIQDGKADMISANCPDKLCVHQKAIIATGETIVCLPNKVVVEVISSDIESELDTIAK